MTSQQLLCGLRRTVGCIIVVIVASAIACRADTPVAAAPSADAGVPAGSIKSAAGFYHPGVLVNRAQLEFVKAKIAAGQQPWTKAFEAAKANPLGSTSY